MDPFVGYCWLFVLLLLGPDLVTDLPLPQVVVRSQSLLYQNQPGRQVDLSKVLPTTELFWLNIEEGYFACQVNASEKYLKLFKLSRLCDGIGDCFEASDELSDELKCRPDCQPACGQNGVCLQSRYPESQCHCDDGYGGKDCSEPDVNECKFSPCSINAECTNTLGSFECTCRQGYEGTGYSCDPSVSKIISDVPYQEQEISDTTKDSSTMAEGQPTKLQEDEKQQVLSTIKDIVEDASTAAVGFEDPNIDLTLQPSIITTTTSTTTVMSTSTTVRESVIGVVNVATPDTSDVQGTTMVVDKVKEIIGDLLTSKDPEKSSEVTTPMPNLSDNTNAMEMKPTLDDVVVPNVVSITNKITVESSEPTESANKLSDDVSSTLSSLTLTTESNEPTSTESNSESTVTESSLTTSTTSSTESTAKDSTTTASESSSTSALPTDSTTSLTESSLSSDSTVPSTTAKGSSSTDLTTTSSQSIGTSSLPTDLTTSSTESSSSDSTTSSESIATSSLPTDLTTSSTESIATSSLSTDLTTSSTESIATSSLPTAKDSTTTSSESSSTSALPTDSTISSTESSLSSDSTVPSTTAKGSSSTDLTTTSSQSIGTSSLPTDLTTSSTESSSSDSTTSSESIATSSLPTDLTTSSTESIATSSLSTDLTTSSKESIATSSLPTDLTTSSTESIATSSLSTDLTTSSPESIVTSSLPTDLTTSSTESIATSSLSTDLTTSSTEPSLSDSTTEKGPSSTDSTTTSSETSATSSLTTLDSSSMTSFPLDSTTKPLTESSSTDSTTTTSESSATSSLTTTDSSSTNSFPLDDSTTKPSKESGSTHTTTTTSESSSTKSTTESSSQDSLTATSLLTDLTTTKQESTDTDNKITTESSSRTETTSTKEPIESREDQSDAGEIIFPASMFDEANKAPTVTSPKTKDTSLKETIKLTTTTTTTTTAAAAAASTVIISTTLSAISPNDQSEELPEKVTSSSTTTTDSVTALPSETTTSSEGTQTAAVESFSTESTNSNETTQIPSSTLSTSVATTRNTPESTTPMTSKTTAQATTTDNTTPETRTATSETTTTSTTTLSPTITPETNTSVQTTSATTTPATTTSFTISTVTTGTTIIPTTTRTTTMTDTTTHMTTTSAHKTMTTTTTMTKTTTTTTTTTDTTTQTSTTTRNTMTDTTTTTDTTTGTTTDTTTSSRTGTTTTTDTTTGITTFASTTGTSTVSGTLTTESATTISPTATTTGSQTTSSSILKPDDSFKIEYKTCQEKYRLCDLDIDSCIGQYSNCQATSNHQPFNGPKDQVLLMDMSECTSAFLGCNAGHQVCQSDARKCLLNSLERARQQSLKNQEPPESRSSEEADEDILVNDVEIDMFNGALSDNFTNCVMEYSTCLESTTTGRSYCTEEFNQCSLAILNDARLDDKMVQGFVYDPTQNQGAQQVEHELSDDLFICIQKYMRCTMKKDKFCMRDYNQCTLAVLEDFHHSADNSEENDLIGREGTDNQNLIEMKPEDSNESDCDGLDLPKTFGSFSGSPAKNSADCTWDFFACTNNYGTWPDNKICCEGRFDACVEMVDGIKPQRPTSSSGSTRPTSSQSSSSENGLRLIDCIWRYMGCARANKPDPECQNGFNQCSKEVMRITTTSSEEEDSQNQAMTGLGQASNGALKPGTELEMSESLAEEFEQHEDSEFLQCIKRLYNCENAGIPKDQCENVELCIVQAVESEEDEEIRDQDKVESSYLPPASTDDKKPSSQGFPDLTPPDGQSPILSQGLPSLPPDSQKPIGMPPGGHGKPVGSFTPEEMNRPSTITTEEPRPVTKPGSTSSTNPQCLWAYFGCGAKNSDRVCKKRFDDCTSGNSFDNQICAGVAENPQAYLVAHPDDCSKFYSCQNLGWRGGYIAHLMDCPPTTGFDTKLRICNYIRALPRCTQEKERKLFREVEGIVARQTRFKKQILDLSTFVSKPVVDPSSAARAAFLKTEKSTADYVKTGSAGGAAHASADKNKTIWPPILLVTICLVLKM